jgi:hypothetical protein
MREAQKGFTTMTNAEASTSETPASVVEEGATVAPETASSKKGSCQKKDVPKGQKAAKGTKAKAAAKKAAKAGKKAANPSRANQASRREQGSEDPGVDRAAQRGDLGRGPEGHRLAGPDQGDAANPTMRVRKAITAGPLVLVMPAARDNALSSLDV